MEARRLPAAATAPSSIGERDVRLSNHRNDRAFSLIELVIVIVIIGIIAAIAIPRLSRGVAGAAEAAVLGKLAVVRGAIDLYVTEHVGKPPTVVSFESQMTEYTDMNGNTSAVKVGPFIYGPYLRAVPENPYNGENTVAAVSQAQAAARTIVVGAGWCLYVAPEIPLFPAGDPVFYASTNTAGVGENAF